MLDSLKSPVKAWADETVWSEYNSFLNQVNNSWSNRYPTCGNACGWCNWKVQFSNFHRVLQGRNRLKHSSSRVFRAGEVTSGRVSLCLPSVSAVTVSVLCRDKPKEGVVVTINVPRPHFSANNVAAVSTFVLLGHKSRSGFTWASMLPAVLVDFHTKGNSNHL